jgi:hypothetical protein
VPLRDDGQVRAVTRTSFETGLDPDKQRGSLTSADELHSVIEKLEPIDSSEPTSVTAKLWLAWTGWEFWKAQSSNP